MGDTIIITGYHKAPAQKAKDIVSKNEFPISHDKKDHERYMWLGEGIYFWQSFRDALWWNKDDYQFGAIISAKMRCDSKEYLDLDNHEEMDQLVEYYEKTIFLLKARNTTVDLANKYQVRSVICSMFKEEHGIKLMRYSFPMSIRENEMGFPIPRGKTQYCATNMAIIRNIKLEANTERDRIIGGSYGYV